MAKKHKQLRRVDDLRKPKPFIRFHFRVIVVFFVVCMLVCLIYYMVRAGNDPSWIITS